MWCIVVYFARITLVDYCGLQEFGSRRRLGVEDSFALSSLSRSLSFEF